MSHDDSNEIDDKFLNRNDLFALEFNSGLVFLQVQGWEECSYYPHTEFGEIASQSDSGFSRLEDPNGDDILYIDEGETKVLHAGIAHRPAGIRRYTNYPEGENRLRTIPNLSVPRPSNGDDYGFVDGNASPYERPTDAEELVIPPGVHLDFNFYNPDQTQAMAPNVKIKMREYNVKPLDHNNYPNVAQRAVQPGSPVPTYPVGSVDNQITMSKLSNSWGVTPVPRSHVGNGGGR